MTETNKKALELLEWCRKNLCTPDGKRICLLCKHEPAPGETVALGIFIAHPENQKRIGAPHGKDRLVIYILCENCDALPDKEQRVEKKIIATVSVQ